MLFCKNEPKITTISCSRNLKNKTHHVCFMMPTKKIIFHYYTISNKADDNEITRIGKLNHLYI